MTTKQLKMITIKDIRSWRPCYDPSKFLKEDWSGTALDILDMREVPFPDRLWAILRPELLSDKLMRLFAVWCARQVQHLMNDDRSLKAIDTAEAFAYGNASEYELAAALDAAWAAASIAALDAASIAAWAAALDAACDAAWAVACDAARAVACDAACDAAWAVARTAQESHLRSMIESGVETGDTAIEVKA